ncbi:hypothetical protein CN424_21690 [Bacillus cereus]|nr:hypothetical protein CN424_21690 [Bacillus cereus]
MIRASVNEIFIGDFSTISAQLEIYQRFFKYIDLPTKTNKKHIKKSTPNFSLEYFFYTNSAYFPASIFSNAAATCSSVNSCCTT